MYPERFKKAVLNRVLSGDLTLAEAADQFFLKPVLLQKWLEYAAKQVGTNAETAPEDQEEHPMNKLLLPQGYTYLQAHRAVVLKQALTPESFGELCRKEGLYAEQVNEWEKWFVANPDAVNSSEYAALKAQLQQTQSAQAEAKITITQQEIEIHKKDAALAEYAALELLGKKLRALRVEKEVG